MQSEKSQPMRGSNHPTFSFATLSPGVNSNIHRSHEKFLRSFQMPSVKKILQQILKRIVQLSTPKQILYTKTQTESLYWYDFGHFCDDSPRNSKQ